jgi:hypothetical protein
MSDIVVADEANATAAGITIIRCACHFATVGARDFDI